VTSGVLIVEDERIVANDLQARLHVLGYPVVGIAATGDQALQIIGDKQPDLVLMDIRLKGAMDGIQTAESIHAHYGIPVVYLSAYADVNTVERAKRTEPFGYLVKPFEDSELRTTIEMALFRKRTEDERRSLQAQLLQAQKMESIGTLVVGLAHNLNNILAIIMGYSSRLERFSTDAAKVDQSVRAINQATHRGALLLQQLIGVTAKANLVFTRIDVSSVIRDLMGMIAEIFPRTISFTTQFGSGLPPISADPNQIHQALLNILVNARDAMQAGGSVTLSTEMIASSDLRGRFPNPQDLPYIRIRISDTGEGMTEETRAHAFDPFFTTKEGSSAAGLGLSVVYGIVSSHKGFIDVASSAGKGTTVDLYFPADPGTASEVYHAVPKKSEPRTDLPGGNETILVVEDEEMLRGLVREVLTRAGYTVVEASDGEEGVYSFARNSDTIDLVLLDLGLPIKAGDAVFAEIKLVRPEVPVVFSTGYVKKEKSEELMAMGARGVVHKPYAVEELLITIRSALDNHGKKKSTITP
jgi:two-component system, cell cycle sensor histidine kinase and response regulator CckA